MRNYYRGIDLKGKFYGELLVVVVNFWF